MEKITCEYLKECNLEDKLSVCKNNYEKFIIYQRKEMLNNLGIGSTDTETVKRLEEVYMPVWSDMQPGLVVKYEEKK
jgi:hypothetical protein